MQRKNKGTISRETGKNIEYTETKSSLRFIFFCELQDMHEKTQKKKKTREAKKLQLKESELLSPNPAHSYHPQHLPDWDRREKLKV